jgi:hypothetical protein
MMIIIIIIVVVKERMSVYTTQRHIGEKKTSSTHP